MRLSGILLLFGSLLLFSFLTVTDHDVVSHSIAVRTCHFVVTVPGGMGLAEANVASLLLREATFSVIGSRVRRATEWTMAQLVTQ
jgi:hypothetical protein